MNVHDTGSTVEQFVDYLEVSRWLGANRPIGINLSKRDLGVGALLDGLGIADVVVRLECLRTEPPELGSNFRIFRVAHDDVLLDQHRHLRGIFSSSLGASVKFVLVLLPSLWIGNQTVG